jgi:uncharacterized protein YhfF
MNMTGLTKTRLTIAVQAVADEEFKQASADFAERHGSGDTWKRLYTAMWALQASRIPAHVDALAVTGVGYWIDKLETLHRTEE